MRPLAAGLALAAVAMVALATGASAHPLGNFSVNRYSRIEVGPDRTTLRYVLDLAEIPALQELQAARLASDASEDEVRRAILPGRSARIAEAAQLVIGDRRAAWDIRDASLTLPEGQAGLRTMRIAMTLVAAIPAHEGDTLVYRDGNEPGRSGWHEVVARGVDGVELTESTVAATDASDELRRYGADPLVAPLDVERASARVAAALAPSATAPPHSPATSARLAIDDGVDRLAAFLRGGTPDDPRALLAALAAAAVLGALHALGPGHGKAIVGAYLVGSRGTAAHAVLLGATVTATHTAGVYALGLLTLVAAQYVLPERIYPVLGAASGVLVAGIGLGLARSRLGRLRGRHAAHDHGHGHGHDHAHDDGHRHDGVGLRSILALGVSGGLLPCPTALVVLLAAISFHDVGLGMALVAAFSVGLASVLTAIGLLIVLGGRALGRSDAARALGASRVVRALPAVSALAIALAGAVITIEALRAFA